MQNAFHFRDLMVGHRPSNKSPSRVGSIIEAIRPSFILDRDAMPDQIEIAELSDPSKALLKQRVAEVAPSVGAVEVYDGNDWRRLATCFRVTVDTRRVATARHTLRALLNPGVPIQCVPDSAPVVPAGDRGFRKARVVFENFDGSADISVGISGIEWAHSRWDLMLLKLDSPCDRPGLVLAHDSEEDIDASNEVCVIGYPALSDAASSANSFSEVFDGALGIKRSSFGLMRRPSQGVFGHDASTLPGSSGSPIVSLETGMVLGIHYFGGTGRDDPNRGVFLPEALSERHLCARMVDGVPTADSTPADWPNTPRFRSGQALSNIRSDGEELAANDSHLAEALMPDRKDIRDRFYQPPLQTAQHAILPDKLSDADIACQADPFSCTGFALAAVINKELREDRRTRGQRVSPVMIYALATQNDEFVDDLPGGSSLRGAIKGLYHFGVCLEQTAPYSGYDPGWHLTINSAKEARNLTLGAYYRLNTVLTDYQLAIQEAGAVVVSAHLHYGWKRGKKPVRRIPHKPGRIGAHAFALVGYDDRGFIIQNSWGADWGNWKDRKGHAHWSYADWAANLIDGWVLRLAPRAPEAFDLQVRQSAPPMEKEKETDPSPISRLRDPRRFALIGHTIHAERGGIRDYGRIGIGAQSLRETAVFLASETGCKKYSQLALIFHEPTLGDDAISRVSSNMIEPFKANGIYPLHIAYGIDEMRSLVVRMQDESRAAARRTNGSTDDLTAFLNRRARTVVQPMLHSWLNGIDDALKPGGGLWLSLASIGLEAGKMAEAAGARSVNILSFGNGWAVADKVIDACPRLGFGQPKSIGRVAPTLGINRASLPGTKTQDWHLSTPPPFATVLPNYTGDWPDLFAAMLPHLSACPRMTSKEALGPDLASVYCSTEAMNDTLKLMLGRKPAATRRFA